MAFRPIGILLLTILSGLVSSSSMAAGGSVPNTEEPSERPAHIVAQETFRTIAGNLVLKMIDAQGAVQSDLLRDQAEWNWEQADLCANAATCIVQPSETTGGQ